MQREQRRSDGAFPARCGSVEDNTRLAELAKALTALKVNTSELLQRKKQLQQLNRLLTKLSANVRGYGSTWPS